MSIRHGRQIKKKLTRIIYELGGFSVVFSMFLPSLILALIIKASNFAGQYTPIVAILVCVFTWLIIAFNFHKIDPLMKKWRVFCGVEYKNKMWREWS